MSVFKGITCGLFITLLAGLIVYELAALVDILAFFYKAGIL